MKTNLEIEYKSLINKTEYKKFLELFDFSREIIQTNVYFDTPDAKLYNLKMMCRIRIIEDVFEFTLKVPQSEGVMEFEVTLDELSLDHPAIKEHFSTLGINVNELNETCRSTTHRRIFIDKYGEWCLDDNAFNNHHDFEIEYELHEANEKAYPHFVDTLQLLNIKFKKAEPKYIRALHSSQQE